MKNTYIIRVYLSDREKVADLLDKLEGFGALELEVIAPSKTPSIDLTDKKAKPAKTAAPKADKRKRKSKVNQALLSRLNEGQATISELKSALESAGMSAASLSTGIAALTKSGEIARIGDGVYDVTKHDAAA